MLLIGLVAFFLPIFAINVKAEEGKFYAYVKDINNCRVNAWYAENQDKYYIFMTPKDNISNVDLHYLSNELSEEKYTEKVLPSAFASKKEIIVSNTSIGDITIVLVPSYIPSLYIDLDGTTLAEIQSDKSEKHAGNKVFLSDPNGIYDLTQNKVEIKGRGNSSWALFDKKGYQIKFDKKTSLLGMDKAKKWCLIANASDDSLMKNYLAFNLANQLGLNYGIHGKFVDLWIEGDYQGLYLLTEKAEIDDNRVALSENDGALYEWDQAFYKDEDYYFYNDTWGGYFTVKESVNEEPDEVKKTIASFEKSLDDFYKYITTTKKADIKLADLDKYIDTKSVAIYYLVNEYCLNQESIVTSFYWYKDGANDVIHLGPVWDFDTCMNFNGNDSYAKYFIWQNPVIDFLLSVPDFYDYVEKLYKDNSQLFSGMCEDVLTLEREIGNSATMNYIRWNYLGQKNPKGGYYAETYDKAVSQMVSWLVKRQSGFVPMKRGARTYSVDTAKNSISFMYEPIGNYSSMKLAVWSDEERTDLRWYPCEKMKDGVWLSSINLLNHNNIKTLTYHIYADDECIDGGGWNAEKLVQISTEKYKNTDSAVDKFTDINKDEWYASAVQYVYSKGTMTGTSESSFNPGKACTREMIVTILYRMSGEPDVAGLENPFADVKADMWYTDAIKWAYKNNITTGMDKSRFGIGKNVTREQIATFLVRYADYKGNRLAEPIELDEFPDADNVSEFAKLSMKRAAGSHIINGKLVKGKKILAAKSYATRSEVAQMIMNFNEKN